jgi:hypothetical protein
VTISPKSKAFKTLSVRKHCILPLMRLVPKVLLVTVGVNVLALVTCISLQADGTKSKSLPPGIVKALAFYEKEYCDQFLGSFKKGCKQSFQANLLWRELEISPRGRTALLVENHNMGACGSAGCSLFLFIQQQNAKFTQVLGTMGDVGVLDSVKTLKTVTASYYDIQKLWHDGKTETIYRWDGQRYTF